MSISVYQLKWGILSIASSLSIFFSPVLLAWNAFGHLLIAQIAYDQLTPQERYLFQKDNQILNQNGERDDVVKSAVWLDNLRSITWHQKLKSLNKLHYIGIPYAPHHVFHQRKMKMNAVLAVLLAQKMLSDTNTNALDRGIAVRILWHVVGDIHQPLHCIQYINNHYPKGDRGGNLYLLGPNPWGRNLHAYWDKGGGYLVKHDHQSLQREVKHQAKMIEAKWSCQKNLDLNPRNWANESYRLAIDAAYQIPEYTIPSDAYQKKVVSITEERIALAGCRLAAVVKQIFKHTH